MDQSSRARSWKYEQEVCIGCSSEVLRLIIEAVSSRPNSLQPLLTTRVTAQIQNSGVTPFFTLKIYLSDIATLDTMKGYMLAFAQAYSDNWFHAGTPNSDYLNKKCLLLVSRAIPEELEHQSAKGFVERLTHGWQDEVTGPNAVPEPGVHVTGFQLSIRETRNISWNRTLREYPSRIWSCVYPME